MKMDKKTVIAIVLAVAAVGLILYQFKGAFSSAKTMIASSAPVATPQSAAAASQPQPSTSSPEHARLDDYTALIAELDESDIAFENKIFKNPMRPLVSDATRGTREAVKDSGPATTLSRGPIDALSMGYTIEGIVWNVVDPLALVNNQVVGVSEELSDGALITEITPDTVRFTKNGNKYYLVLREE